MLARRRFSLGISSILTLSTVVVITVLMAVTTVLDTRRERAIFHEELEQRGLLFANTLNDVLADPLYHADIDDLRDIAEVMFRQPEVTFVQVFGPDGRLLVDTQQTNKYVVGVVGDEFSLNAIRSRQTLFRTNGNALEFTSPIYTGTEVFGGVRFGFDLTPVESKIRAITIQRLVQGLVIIALGGVLSYLLAQYFVRPLKRLVSATEKISRGEYDFRIGSQRSDEIGDLTMAFIDMTSSLEARTTERDRAEKTLQQVNRDLEARVQHRTVELEDVNKQLMVEVIDREVLAEIGRVISSSLDVNEGFELFVDQTRKLIDFDGVQILRIDHSAGKYEIVYHDGALSIPGRRWGDVLPLDGSLTGHLVQEAQGQITHLEDRDEVLDRFPVLAPIYDTGLRSIVSVPLISKDVVIGVLHLVSEKPEYYTDRDLDLAERIGRQITGTISNALLRTSLEREAIERETLSEIGRIISSSLDIEEVYEAFAQRVRTLIPVDRLTINTIDVAEGTFTSTYLSGIDVPTRRRGNTLPLAGSITGEAVRTRATAVLMTEDRDELERKFPGRLPGFDAGLRSFMAVPLESNGEIIAVLHLRSFKPNAYTDRDIDLAERVGAQIAGAIANSELHGNLEREAGEKEVLAEIGRIISSSLDIGEVYERFADQVARLLSFDRLGISEVNKAEGNCRVLYTSGSQLDERGPGTIFPLEGSLAGLAIEGEHGVVLQGMNREELETKFPHLLLTFDAGYRSWMCAPFMHDNRLIGVLHLATFDENAYTSRALSIVEQISVQIAGAVYNARLHAELERQSKEGELLAEIGKIISSSLDIDQVYERFAERVRQLVRFDRLSIVVVDYDLNTATTAYAWGVEIPEWQPGNPHALDQTIASAILRTGRGMITGRSEFETMSEEYPLLAHGFRSAGLQSRLSVPLTSDDDPIGVMTMNSNEANAFTEPDLALVQRIGIQIAGAIANAQLHAKQQRMEAERRELEHELRQAQKMEAVGRLAGGIAHEFNNVVTPIIGFSTLGIERVPKTDRVYQYLQEIQKSGHRAAELTQQLLTFSRHRANEPKVINLNDLIRDIELMVRRLIGEHLELVFEHADDLWMVKADPGQLEQVLVNLLLNSRDAMPAGGRIVIETTNEELDDEYAASHPSVRAGKYVVLGVRDLGTGIPDEVKEHIFEPFFTTKEVGKGTGLGLSVSYGIVTDMGGHIDVVTEPGGGTTFKIYLPKVDELPILDEKVDDEAHLVGGNETLLLVDDDEIVREVVVEILTNYGYTVLEARNGFNALSVIEEHSADKIDLLLTDIVMPLMSGTELATRFRELSPESSVLYFSGYSSDFPGGNDLDGTPFLQKPFSPSVLARKIREVLDES